jgi:type III secretion system YscD/HrpQ family protein
MDAVTEQRAANSLNRTTVLRLLSGLQQGAEARLTDGVIYLIGSADECDIVVQDPSVAPKHLSLMVVRQGQIRLDVQEQPIIVGDRSLSPGQSIDLTAVTAIQLGVVQIGIGPEQSDWTSLASPKGVDPAPSAAAQEQLVIAAKAEPVTFQPSSPGPDGSSIHRLEPAQRRGSITRWAVFGSLALIAVALIVLRTPWSNEPDAGAAVDLARPEPSAVEKAQAFLAEQGVPDVGVIARPNGGVILTGYCETREVKNRLTAILLAQGILADNRLWPEEVLRETIAHTLERLGGKRLSYDYLGKGALRLRGRLHADLSYDQLVSVLQNDVPGIGRIDSQLKTLADEVTALQERVRQAGLAEQVAIATEGEKITATGALDAERLERWKAVAREFATETHEVHPLVQRVKLIQSASGAVLTTASRPAASAQLPVASPISVRGVLIGSDRTAYALLSNGVRVAEGDWIQSRYVVEQIQLNRVVVRDGSQRKTYYIGESAHE